MTLRLRLALFYTLLVAIILAISGLGLHLLLQRSLENGIDTSLSEANTLLTALIQNEDGTPMLRDQGEPPPQLPPDLVAVLYGPDGHVIDSLGRVPAGLPHFQSGLVTWKLWRTLTRPVEQGTLAVLRRVNSVHESLWRFDRVFILFSPIAVVIAFALGYALVGRALAPVDRLTRAAYDLAQRRAWRETLPEPYRRDELWRLTRATNMLLSTLAEVIEGERRFTADAAHELRTPLTVMLGRLEQALEKAADPKSHRALKKALRGTEDLLGLIERLLFLARTEAGQSSPSDLVHLDEIAFDTTERLHPLADAKGIRWELALPENPVSVRGNATSLSLLLRNLLENALKFSDAGMVRVAIMTKQNHALLIVEDRGPGIPDNVLPHIFERFYQGDVHHRQGGSGLGLALVQSVARWHGGRAWAQNRRDGGARFCVELPLA